MQHACFVKALQNFSDTRVRSVVFFNFIFANDGIAVVIKPVDVDIGLSLTRGCFRAFGSDEPALDARSLFRSNYYQQFFVCDRSTVDALRRF